MEQLAHPVLWDEDSSGEWDSANNPDVEADSVVAAAIADVDAGADRRAQASSLSALAQQMLTYPVIKDPDEQQRLLDLHFVGLRASALLNDGRKRTEKRIDTLHAHVNAGNDAGNRLAASMFRLTRKMAMEQATNRYGRARAMAIIDDLIADANVALVESFTSYDVARCPSFSLYAGKVVRTTITNRLQESTDSAHMTLPGSWLRTKRWAVPLINEVAAEKGRDLTLAETRKILTDTAMGWAYERLTDEQKAWPRDQREELMLGKLVKQGTIGAIRNWEALIQQSTTASSLDAVSDGSRALADTLADTSDVGSTFDAAELAGLHGDLMAALNTFEERERDIILHRFRFVDGRAWTFSELEPKFGISAERVRQLEQKVLRALSGPKFAQLGSYLQPDDETPDDSDAAPVNTYTDVPPWKRGRARHGTSHPRGP